MGRIKLYCLCTIVLGGILLGMALRLAPPHPLAMASWDMPPLGDPRASHTLLLFEDFHCPHCRHFQTTLFPAIQRIYIETGRIRLILVPISLSAGSRPWVEAAYAVAEVAPDRFHPFVEEVFHREPLLLEGKELDQAIHQVVRDTGGISLSLWREVWESRSFLSHMEVLQGKAKKLMGKRWGAPTLYFEGKEISHASLTHVQESLERGIH